MSYADVCEAVESLQRKYCERDPFRLCADMGIKLLYQPLGTDPDAIKGFYLESKRIRTITVNCNLPVVIQRIIVSHELGHAVLHRILYSPWTASICSAIIRDSSSVGIRR